jgi:hypothetical protein
MRKIKIANVLLIAALMLSISSISVPTLQQSLGEEKNFGCHFWLQRSLSPT